MGLLSQNVLVGLARGFPLLIVPLVLRFLLNRIVLVGLASGSPLLIAPLVLRFLLNWIFLVLGREFLRLRSRLDFLLAGRVVLVRSLSLREDPSGRPEELRSCVGEDLTLLPWVLLLGVTVPVRLALPIGVPSPPVPSRILRHFCFSLSTMTWQAFLVRPSGSVILSHGIAPVFSMIWNRSPNYARQSPPKASSARQRSGGETHLLCFGPRGCHCDSLLLAMLWKLTR